MFTVAIWGCLLERGRFVWQPNRDASISSAHDGLSAATQVVGDNEKSGEIIAETAGHGSTSKGEAVELSPRIL